MPGSTPDLTRPRRLSAASQYTNPGDVTTNCTSSDFSTQQGQAESSNPKGGTRSQAGSNAMTSITKFDEIDRLEQGARSSFEETMQPILNRARSSEASSMFGWISSMFKDAASLNCSEEDRIAEQDRHARQLDAMIIKHKENHGMGMKDALIWFQAIVPIAWKRPDSATTEQRAKVKDFLKQVLRSGVPIRTGEIDSVLIEVIGACNLGPDKHKSFYRLCILWFDMFLSEDDEQSSPLGLKVVDFLHGADAKDKEDLAKLWKFTHTLY